MWPACWCVIFPTCHHQGGHFLCVKPFSHCSPAALRLLCLCNYIFFTYLHTYIVWSNINVRAECSMSVLRISVVWIMNSLFEQPDLEVIQYLVLCIIWLALPAFYETLELHIDIECYRSITSKYITVLYFYILLFTYLGPPLLSCLWGVYVFL